MEVYETPEQMTFVHAVGEGDLVTIPFLNYHPVFSQESPGDSVQGPHQEHAPKTRRRADGRSRPAVAGPPRLQPKGISR